MTDRIEQHPILGPCESRRRVTFTMNNQPLEGRLGEPIAAALLANGIRLLRRHEETGSPRGIYCAIGQCMECRLYLKGQGYVRSCITPLCEHMELHEGQQLPNEITGRK